ncbi:MAG: hypothetical protein ACRD11_15610 [Terriglobia bacterium]
MKKKRVETAATIILGAVCVGLIFHLAVRVRDVHAGAVPVGTRYGSSAVLPARMVDPARRGEARAPAADPGGPALNLALYQELQSQTVPTPDRDPFAFEPTPQQLQQVRRDRAAQAAASGAASAPAPPPPPPIPVQTVGYGVNAQGQLEAFLADSQQVYVVRTGDEFDKAYRVVMITPAMVEIEDESLHRTVELPFPK